MPVSIRLCGSIEESSQPKANKMHLRILFHALLLITYLGGSCVRAAGRGLTDTSASAHVRLRSVDMDAVRWTEGFWAERLDWCHKVVIPNMWGLFADPNISNAYENFLGGAGQKPGR